MIDYDAHLNPKIRRRERDEIEQLLREDRRAFLRHKADKGEIWALITRLSQADQASLFDDIVSRIEDNTNPEDDREFMGTVDLEDYTWEEY